MNTKKTVRSVKLAILRALAFIPDKPMLKMQYRIKTGRRLDLKDPKRFTEKLQWYKLYHKDPEMVRCVDKYDVRDYVTEKGLGETLIPCLGIYDSADQIDWDALPESFVMKDTLGSGGNSVVIVRDKGREDLKALSRTAAAWTAIDPHVRDGGREWPYYSGKAHRILFEKYIESSEDRGGLLDYKFFCFNGRVEFLFVTGDRRVGQSVSLTFFDRDFKQLPVKRVGDKLLEGIKRPANFDRMVAVAERLSEGFPHVRVDLYDQDDVIRFGELTFYNASGYMKYEPDEFDLEAGEKFLLK